jgi:putative intracellular protease/amidase
MKKRGALYEKALLPFVPKAVVDGRLVTGQSPQSAKVTAELSARQLSPRAEDGSRTLRSEI